MDINLAEHSLADDVFPTRMRGPTYQTLDRRMVIVERLSTGFLFVAPLCTVTHMKLTFHMLA